MDILAYIDGRYLMSAIRVVGEEADYLLSPPLLAADVRPQWFGGYDLIYLDLHGEPGESYLYSTEMALAVETVREMNLGGAVVFATTCYLPQTLFVDAFVNAGARAVVGGAGENWAARRRITGAHELARRFIRNLAAGQEVEAALDSARGFLEKHLFLRIIDRQAVADALAFRVWRSETWEAQPSSMV